MLLKNVITKASATGKSIFKYLCCKLLYADTKNSEAAYNKTGIDNSKLAMLKNSFIFGSNTCDAAK